MQATGVHVCWISVVVIKYNQIKLQYICKEQFFHILAVPVFASDVSGVQTVLCLLQKDKIYWSWWDKYDIISTWIAKKKLLRSHPLNFHLGAYPLLNLFPEIIQNCNSSILFTPYTITSVCTFFTLFLNTLPKVLHSCNPNVWFRDDIVWGNWMLHVCTCSHC